MPYLMNYQKGVCCYGMLLSAKCHVPLFYDKEDIKGVILLHCNVPALAAYGSLHGRSGHRMYCTCGLSVGKRNVACKMTHTCSSLAL